MADLEKRKLEIISIVADIAYLQHNLARAGIDARDPEDRLEAMDIINRLERKMRAKQPAK